MSGLGDPKRGFPPAYSICRHVSVEIYILEPSLAFKKQEQLPWVSSATAPSLPLFLRSVFSCCRASHCVLPERCQTTALLCLLSAPAVRAPPPQHPINSLFLGVIRLCLLPGRCCCLSCAFVCFQGPWACARWVSNEQD